MKTNRASDAAEQGRKDLESSPAWREIETEFFETGRAEAVQQGLSRLIDAAAADAYGNALTRAFSGPAAMFAAGGFGRGELFPCSSVDIVIVHEGDAPPNLNEALAGFARLLWEKGVSPSLKVLTERECLAAREQDADVSLKLMDRRTLAGDPALATRLEDGLASLYAKHGQRLGQHLATLTRARHAKYENTPSHKEPDVKDSPGGLEDLRLLAGLRKLFPEKVGATETFGHTAALFSSIRCFLHYRAREDRNILDNAAQQAIVDAFFGGTARSLWMRDYFGHAREVFKEARRALDLLEEESGSLIGTFRAWQSRLSNAEFTVARERVYLRRPGELEIDPESVFRLLEFVAAHGVLPAPDTERRLEAAKAAVAAFCEQPPRPLWPAIQAILSQPHAAKAFRVLQNTDLLPSILPQWARIEGMAASSPDLLYTLDEHTLMAMERIDGLREATDPLRKPFAELLSEIDDQAVLLFALLFHHMGAAEPPQAAASLGKEAGSHLQMPSSDRDTVEFLIERQAILPDASSGRDVDDPATVRLLAERIGTIERLTSLTVLTYADVAATYSGATVAWRLEQLWRTYLATKRELTRELETDRIQALPASLSGNAEFIRGFPTRYLRAHTAADIEAHARLYELSRPTGVAVQFEQTGGAHSLTVVARDKPALFASFAGAISSFGLDIVKAEAFSNSEGVILDTFLCADPKHTLELNPSEAERLQDLIRRVAQGKTDARRLLRNPPHRDSHKPVAEPRVRFDSEACETATLVEIMADDRPGLLYSLAMVFSSSACNIDVVLIDTKGHRAIDVFYVTQDGKKLSPESQARVKERLLAACSGD